ncbi:probable disease resistance protein At4g33300 [Cryptomeria japonica]|uniref:probable disease resistance protein At4g33300 n=1 Tax=Cryptomeria japonica TaxID=3369 RepID=UPI0027DAA832|nr:probable disease resistance protein At4g33300 [Cryptomeria japonica]
MQSEPTLMILDDVWSKEDLDKLLFEGTRYKTLITSRDSSIISKKFLNEVYQLPLLGEQDALSLLCFWAFGQTSIPSMIDVNLVKKVLEECGGLPLALKVIGSSLKGQTHVAWERAKSKILNGEIISDYYDEGILRCLESSIDSLDDVVKECFLDLGLFPKGKKICVDVLLQIWVNIRKIKWQDAIDILFKLARRNLINLSNNQRIKRTLSYGNALELNFFQHDIIRDLSLYLGCKDNVEDRKRLLMPRREHDILEKWKLYSNIAFNAQVVSIHTGPMEESQWHEMLFPKAEVLVLLFNASEYFLPPFVKTMKNLKIIMVFNYGSKRAILKGLDALSSLNQLKVVYLEKLISIPNESNGNILDNLENLSLSLCKGIENVPKFNSTKIRSFNLDHCSDLEDLPSSIFHMPNVQLWSITNCHLVQNLSHSIGNLLNLRVLRLSAMPGLKELPTSIGALGLLEYLDISLCENLRELLEEIGKLKSLIELDMRECSSLKKLPKAVCQLSSLKHVMCDEKIGKQWLQAKRISIPILEVEIIKLHFSLDWLDD